MRRYLILIICALILAVTPAYGWGRLGHATIAKIAENYLTPKAKKTLDKYLDGQSIVYYASYPDDYREVHLIDIGFDAPNSPRTTVWPHSFRASVEGVPFRTENVNGEYAKNGLVRIEPVIKNMKENHRNMTDSARLVSIAYIVHVIGDIHCPKHIRYWGETSSGGYPVYYRGKKVKYHSYWDSILLSSYHPMGYSELAQLIDRHSTRERKEIMKGDIYAWGEENARESLFTRDCVKGTKITRMMANEDIKHAEKQLVRAGYRLAALLNTIFK